MKPHEAVFLHMPWTGGVRTSQGTCSKHSSWEPWQKSHKEQKESQRYQLARQEGCGRVEQCREHRKRPGHNSGIRDTHLVTSILQKITSQLSSLPSETIKLQVHKGIDPFIRSEPGQSIFLDIPSQTHPGTTSWSPKWLSTQ